MKTAIKRNRPYVTHGYHSWLLSRHTFKKALKLSFCRTVWNCFSRALHVLRESKKLVDACKLPSFLVVSPLELKIVDSGLFLRVFRTKANIFIHSGIEMWIQCTMCSYESKSLILAVRRTHVKHKPCIWPSSPQLQRSSVVRASDRCTVGHIGLINVGDSDFFLCPVLMRCWSQISFLHRT